MSSSGSGSDVMMLWANAADADCRFGCVVDQWAASQLQPTNDPQQSLTLIGGEQQPGFMV